jgi:hypothetical protein
MAIALDGNCAFVLPKVQHSNGFHRKRFFSMPQTSEVARQVMLMAWKVLRPALLGCLAGLIWARPLPNPSLAAGDLSAGDILLLE